MIRTERVTANLEGDFVVFLIGLRINRPLRVDQWMPVAAAMPRMLKELARQPELGFLHAEMWFSRTIFMLQYWRSMDQLIAYAKNKEAEHLPAWQAFNKNVGTSGTVGIWHETYAASPGSYENIYLHAALWSWQGRHGAACCRRAAVRGWPFERAPPGREQRSGRSRTRQVEKDRHGHLAHRTPAMA